MQQESLREARRRLNYSRELEKKGWYHSFRLPDGVVIDGCVSLEQQLDRWARFPIPEDLTGKRVLDVGAWDGWFSFEAERLGAEVTAVDCVEIPNFLDIHRRLGSRTDYRILDVYELPDAGLGKFDIVFFLGVLYHLKHPLLALEIVCGMTSELALVESFVTDGESWRERRQEIPSMEFYETDELGEQLDNWIGPSVECLLALCRAAGFARAELVDAHNHNAIAACHRRWEPVPANPSQPPPKLVSVLNSRNFGVNFSRRKDEYIACWFETGREQVSRDELRLEAGGYGVPALSVRRDRSGSWLANFRFPPGLGAGWHDARLRLADSDFSAAHRIAVDLPLKADRLALRGVFDGVSWESGKVKVSDQGFVSCWIKGLGDNCDRNNVRVFAGQTRLRVEWVGEPDEKGYRQVNAVVPDSLARDVHPFRVEFAGVTTDPVPLQVE